MEIITLINQSPLNEFHTIQAFHLALSNKKAFCIHVIKIEEVVIK